VSKNLLQKLGSKIIQYFIPEISILRKNIYWNKLSDFTNCKFPSTSKIYSPYNIQNSEIGDYTYIEQNSFINFTSIGKFCSIGPNLLCGWGIHPTNGISTAPMFYSTRKQNGITLSNTDKIKERKQIKIGNDVFIGINVTILDGITIGDGAIIGAGSVVSKNIPPYAIAVGSPIKIINYRFKEEQIEKLRKIKWWNFDEKELKTVEKLFFNIDEFIEKYTQ
jgi:virginiamycin A acetyltransferase